MTRKTGKNTTQRNDSLLYLRPILNLREHLLVGLLMKEIEFMLRKMSYLETTRNIRVQVTPKYMEEKSIPLQNDFVFQYSIKIINSKDSDIQILGSELTINDGHLEEMKIISDDVNEEQPCIPFKDVYQYTEYCPINTSTGNLRGFFWARNMQSGEIFQIKIPLVFFKTIDTPVKPVDIQRPLYAASM